MARKRKPGHRERNGRLSRKQADVAQRQATAWDAQERDSLSVALEARQRLYGLSEQEARGQEGGTFIGRLLIAHRRAKDEAVGITQIQYDALVTWETSARASLAALYGPMQDGAFDPNRVQGRGMGQDDAYAARIVAKHAEAKKAVQERQNELRGRGALLAALYECVQRDRAHFHLVGDLRQAANALVRHYGLEARRAAA